MPQRSSSARRESEKRITTDGSGHTSGWRWRLSSCKIDGANKAQTWRSSRRKPCSHLHWVFLWYLLKCGSLYRLPICYPTKFTLIYLPTYYHLVPKYKRVTLHVE
jgi:hypothetical protein